MNSASLISINYWGLGLLHRNTVYFLLLQCVESALPVGGQITVTKNGSSWQIEARGEKLKTDNPWWKHLNSKEESTAAAASDVHFALVPEAARNAGRPVAAYLGDDRITLSF